MNRIGLTGLCQIDLPDHTIRLCDGGRIDWDGEVFRARDAEFGTIGSVEPLSEGASDEIVPLVLTLLPSSTAAAADLVQPAFQGSRVRLWLAEFDVASGMVVGDPTLRFDGELDQAALTLQLELELTVVAAVARLFELNIGNSLSPAFHKSVWPGETGHDQATGLSFPDAWGVEGAPMPASRTSGGGNLGGFDPFASGLAF